jgi:hypothetical protein
MNWIVLVVLAQAQVAAPVPPVQKEPPRWEVFLGFQGGIRPDSLGGGGGAVLGVNRLFFSWLRPELSLGLGAYSAPLDVLTLIRLGARFELPLAGRLRPFLGVYFAHQHESGWEHIKQDPVPSIIGLSEHGVHHRSGLETSLGLTYEFLARKGSMLSGRLGLKAGVTHLLGHGPPRYVELTTLVGLCF